MDILQVLIARYEANMSERMFEMNASILRPTEKGSLDRLESAVKEYTILKNQVDVLQDLRGQMLASQKFQRQEAEKQNATKKKK
jgi:hypothetical protein|tara:strand:+ start:550 stop:801 length:252 start_codon:yes stop_codon:yes gene_type:complete